MVSFLLSFVFFSSMLPKKSKELLKSNIIIKKMKLLIIGGMQIILDRLL
jgi:hypothetical protein